MSSRIGRIDNFPEGPQRSRVCSANVLWRSQANIRLVTDHIRMTYAACIAAMEDLSLCRAGIAAGAENSERAMTECPMESGGEKDHRQNFLHRASIRRPIRATSPFCYIGPASGALAPIVRQSS